MALLLTALPQTKNQVIYVLIAIVLIVFALVGAIGWLIELYIEDQGLRVDEGMTPLVEGKAVNKPAHFKKIAYKKSHRQAFVEFLSPILITGLALAFLYSYIAITEDATLIDDLWNYSTRGFNTLFYIWDWENIPLGTFFGLTIPNDWPTLLNAPRFVAEAWPSYVYISLLIIAGILFFFATLALFARTVRIEQQHHRAFIKRLDQLQK